MGFNREEIFKGFEDIRVSGVINMYDIKMGCELSGLTREEWIYCMDNYEELYDEFGTEV
jgi:hypothetical protein